MMSAQNGTNRRDLFKTAALGLGTVAASGLVSREVNAAEAVPSHWDQEADVVIVGYGFAGAAAALTAQGQGAKVLVLEKAPERFRGGNSRVSGNAVFWPNDVEKAKIYFRAFSGAYMDDISQRMLDTWATEMYANRAWLESLGWKPVHFSGPEYPNLPGSDCVDVLLHGPGPLGQARLWDNVIEAAVIRQRIPIAYETAAVRLVQRGNEVVGVAAEQNGKRLYVKANRAVILATGGFEHNLPMIRSFLNDIPKAAPMGTPYNTGDGIQLALGAGADLWHTANISGPMFTFLAPGYEVASIVSMPAPNFVWVAADGTRFVAEGDPISMGSHGKLFLHGRWVQMPCPLPVHLVFDETFRTAGGLGGNQTGWTMGWDYTYKIYDWSPDNSREIAKGWIKSAPTIGALAAAIGLPQQGLQATIQRFNGFASAHKDEDYGRRPQTMQPIRTPPFYAMELTPAFLNTQGGPRRNENAQIVGADGNAIPRLYSSGELGSIYGFCYQGGGNVAECLAFGRVAGRNAAAAAPWS